MKTFKNYLEQVQGINEAFSEDFEDDYRDDFMALIGPYLSTKQFDLVLNLTHEWHAKDIYDALVDLKKAAKKGKKAMKDYVVNFFADWDYGDMDSEGSSKVYHKGDEPVTYGHNISVANRIDNYIDEVYNSLANHAADGKGSFALRNELNYMIRNGLRKEYDVDFPIGSKERRTLEKKENAVIADLL